MGPGKQRSALTETITRVQCDDSRITILNGVSRGKLVTHVSGFTGLISRCTFVVVMNYRVV